MKEFKGTPGPWVMDNYGNILHETETGAVGKLRVSGVRLPNRVTEEFTANTKLIAAAPDLLTELQKLRGYVINVCGVDDEDCDSDHPLMSSQAAISKALGEE